MRISNLCLREPSENRSRGVVGFRDTKKKCAYFVQIYNMYAKIDR